MKNQLNKEVSQKQKIKITDLYNNSVFFVSRALDDEMIDKLSKTALKLVLKLNRYFSSETGQRNQRKEYSVTELRKELAINQKDISLKCVLDIVEQIRVNKLFFIFDGFYGKEKTFTFFLPSLKNEELFEAVEKDKGYFKNKMATHFFENNIKNLPLKNENSSSNSENSSSSFWNSSSNSENSSSNFEEVKSIENTEKIEQLESCQEAYIKEALNKEALHNIEGNEKSNNVMDAFFKKGNDLGEEKQLNQDNSKNQKLDEVKIKVKEISKTKKSDKKTLTQVVLSDEELDELDKIKRILINDYGFTDADHIIKKYSIKCFYECIEMTVTAEENGKIESSTGGYLRTKLKYWQETTVDSKKDISNNKKSISSNQIEIKRLENEEIFSKFCIDNGVYPCMQSLDGFETGLDSLISFASGNKQFMIDFKKIGVTKSNIESFIARAEKNNKFLYTNSNNLNKERVANFYEIFDNPDLILENTCFYPVKPKNAFLEKVRLEAEKLKNKLNSIQDINDDFIP